MCNHHAGAYARRRREDLAAETDGSVQTWRLAPNPRRAQWQRFGFHTHSRTYNQALNKRRGRPITPFELMSLNFAGKGGSRPKANAVTKSVETAERRVLATHLSHSSGSTPMRSHATDMRQRSHDDIYAAATCTLAHGLEMRDVLIYL